MILMLIKCQFLKKRHKKLDSNKKMSFKVTDKEILKKFIKIWKKKSAV